MRSTHIAAAFCAMSGLSACGGVSSGSSGFDQYSITGVRLAERFEEAGLTQVMPVIGTGSYAGIAAFVFDSEVASIDSADLASQVTLEVDFSSQTITGQFSNFLDRESLRYSGSVSILNGVISGHEFEANVSGSLTRPSGTSAVTGQMAGAFLGTGAEASAGLVEASAFGSPVSGFFISERR